MDETQDKPAPYECMTSEEIMEGQLNDWIQDELKEIENNSDLEMLPGLVLEENKTEEVEVDISRPWQKWIDKENGNVKKKIPILHAGEKKLFWLNTANPIYRELLKLAEGAAERNEKSFKVKILRTGKQANTRYAIVD